jgi:CubicO group peptidase (beta-lactamase class C family)
VRALRAVEGWPVRRAAVAVVDPDGVVDTVGPVEERFALASVTKPLSALACLVAVEEGALDLDAPVGAHPEPALSGITVRHLLAHASGLAAERHDLVARPGTRRIYSNAGYELLGRELERATGMSFAEYFRQAVVEPLGLAATTLDGSPAAGARASVADLTVLARALLAGGGRVVHPDTLRPATSVQFPGLTGVLPGFGRQRHNDWGLGFEIRDAKSPHWTGSRNSPATYGHFGRSGTFLWVDPVARLACVALTDREFEQWARQAWPALADAVLAEHGASAQVQSSRPLPPW